MDHDRDDLTYPQGQPDLSGVVQREGAGIGERPDEMEAAAAGRRGGVKRSSVGGSPRHRWIMHMHAGTQELAHDCSWCQLFIIRCPAPRA